MTTVFPINCSLLCTVGALPIQGDVARGVFDLLDDEPVRPSEVFLAEEAPPFPFEWGDFETLTHAANLNLRRREPHAWSGVIFPRYTPTVWMRAPGPAPLQDLERWFELAADIAAVTRPDIGWAHQICNAPRPLSTTEATTQWAMDRGVGGLPHEYRRTGPGHLGMRTILGPHILDQIGRDRVRTLPSPAVVTDLSWGGMMIDLVPRPWEAAQDELRASFLASRLHLEPARFFTWIDAMPKGSVKRVQPDNPDREVGGQER